MAEDMPGVGSCQKTCLTIRFVVVVVAVVVVFFRVATPENRKKQTDFFFTEKVKTVLKLSLNTLQVFVSRSPESSERMRLFLLVRRKFHSLILQQEILAFLN